MLLMDQDDQDEGGGGAPATKRRLYVLEFRGTWDKWGVNDVSLASSTLTVESS